MAKAKMTIGVFAGILSFRTGKLLLKRRAEEGSIVSGKSFVGNWELPGGGVRKTNEVSYDYLLEELSREVGEEIGMHLFFSKMSPLYAVCFKEDIAMVTPYTTANFPLAGETTWVSFDRLEELAKDFFPADKKEGISGQGLLSGYGKRMHCMALKALSFSNNNEYAQKAHEALRRIQITW